MVYSTQSQHPLVAKPSVFTSSCPQLPSFPPAPCRLWCLVDREPLHVKSVQRHYNCFVHRLLPPEGQDQTALWRVALYDRADGTEISVVITEEAAVKAVKKHILHSSDHTFHDKEIMKRAWVHKQMKRVDLVGGGKAFTLLQICLYGGPHETVLVEITAFPQHNMQAVNKLVLKLTAEEVKARLSLLDAPTKDLAWWSSTRNRHDIWKPLVSLLQFKTRMMDDGSQHATELVFNDQDMRDKEGFDIYGMMAMACAFLPLARVTPVQKRYGMAYALAFPDILEVSPSGEGAQWEERSDFNLPLSIRVRDSTSRIGPPVRRRL